MQAMFARPTSYGHPSPAVVTRWEAISELVQTQSPTDNALIDGNTAITTNGVGEFIVASDASNRSISRRVDEVLP